MSKNINLNSIDVAKFICAILVVMVHISPFGTSTTADTKLLNFIFLDWIGSLAVPFFFICSGFLLYRKTSLNDFNISYSTKYVFRILKLYLIWTIIYAPFIVLDILQSPNKIQAIFSFIHHTIMTGSYNHLWYLNALIIAILITSFLLYKKIKPCTIVGIASVLYFCGLFAQSWFGFIVPLKEFAPSVWNFLKLMEKIMLTTRNGLFEGFLFVAIGMCFAYFDIYIHKRMALLFFSASMCLLLVEAMLLHYFDFVKANNMYLFLVPSVFFAFCYTIQIELPSNSIYKILRILSSLIYYTHMAIGANVVKGLILIDESLRATPLAFIVTLVLSGACSYIIYSISERQKFKWLKIIYS